MLNYHLQSWYNTPLGAAIVNAFVALDWTSLFSLALNA